MVCRTRLKLEKVGNDKTNMRQKVISLLDRMPAAEAAYSNQSKKINMLLECELEQI